MTLREAVAVVLKQNPELTLARLDEQKGAQGIRIAKDPFWPRIYLGSGLAYSSGFPMSIEGAAPSVIQAKASQFLYNRQQKLLVDQARENARTATIVTLAKQDEIVFRTVSLYLDAEHAGRAGESARKQIENLDKVLQTTRGRIQEGRALPVEASQAALNLARARQRSEALAQDQAWAEGSLAVVLGFGPEDRVRAVDGDRSLPQVASDEDAAVQNAVQSSKELRRLESTLKAKELEARSQRAARLPRLDLVAQYGLFARFNNYEDFFRKFQRNNGQLGMSVQLPLLTGPGVSALTAQAEGEAAYLRTQINVARNQISLDTRRSHQDIRRAETGREVAKLELDLAREQLSVLLAQMEEGRASLRQVEEARFAENEKWIAFYDAQYAIERARYNLLRQTGDLLAALR